MVLVDSAKAGFSFWITDPLAKAGGNLKSGGVRMIEEVRMLRTFTQPFPGGRRQNMSALRASDPLIETFTPT